MLVTGMLVLVVGFAQQILMIKMGFGQTGRRPDPMTALWLFPMMLVYCLAYLPLVTGAHRIVLLKGRGRTGWGLHREEWWYLLATLKISGLVALAVIVFSLLPLLAAAAGRAFGAAPPSMPVAGIFVVAALFLFLISVLSCRYLLILPAAAIGTKLSLRGSKDLMRHNVWRLFLILGLISLVSGLVQFALKLLALDFWILQSAIAGANQVLSGIMLAFVLSLSYRRLALDRLG